MSKRRWFEGDAPRNVNPIWSIVRALKQGYVMRPHTPTSMFTAKDENHCAVRLHAIMGRWRDTEGKAMDAFPLPDACKPQCGECYAICYENDYIRGFLPPRYPVPAIRLEVESYVYDLTIVNVHTGLDVAWFYRS